MLDNFILYYPDPTSCKIFLASHKPLACKYIFMNPGFFIVHRPNSLYIVNSTLDAIYIRLRLLYLFCWFLSLPEPTCQPVVCRELAIPAARRSGPFCQGPGPLPYRSNVNSNSPVWMGKRYFLHAYSFVSHSDVIVDYACTCYSRRFCMLKF